MAKRLGLGRLIVIIAGGLLAYINRAAILTQIVLKRVEYSHYPVIENQPIAWATGPDTAARSAADATPIVVSMFALGPILSPGKS